MAVLTPAAAPPSGDSKSTQNAVAFNSFTRASRRKTEPFLDVQRALTSSGQVLQQVDIPATGYLRSIVLDVEVTGFTAGAYAAGGDAPFSILDRITLADVNGQSIVDLTGWGLYRVNLFGGYVGIADPKQYPLYQANATGIRFQLRIPVEIVQRNALGSLTNLNAAMTYKLKMSLAPILDVFSALPTGTPQVRIRAIVESWGNPPAADLNGIPNYSTPPQIGTTQNWSEYVAPVTVGQNTIRLPRVGNQIRNLLWEFRDQAGNRTDAGFLGELNLLFDGNSWKRNDVAYERQRIFELYGYTTQRPVGSWVTCLTDDFDATPGEEMGDYWLVTSGATRLELQAVSAIQGSLHVLTNDILASAATAGAGQTLGA